MAADQSEPPRTAKALAALERERKEKAEAKTTLWAFLWTLFAFKIVTAAVIWYVAAGSPESISLIVATTWLWLPIPIIAIGGPVLYRWRLIRQRRRREALRRAEWMQEDGHEHRPFSIDDVHLIVHQAGHDGDQAP